MITTYVSTLLSSSPRARFRRITKVSFSTIKDILLSLLLLSLIGVLSFFSTTRFPPIFFWIDPHSKHCFMFTIITPILPTYTCTQGSVDAHIVKKSYLDGTLSPSHVMMRPEEAVSNLPLHAKLSGPGTGAPFVVYCMRKSLCCM